MSTEELYEHAKSSVDSHLDRSRNAIGAVMHPSSERAGSIALVSIAHSLLAIATMLQHVFRDEFGGDE